MSVFAEVVEAKSFSAAAARLGISKSLVSRQVSALERSLSVKLLNRTTRKLSLTEGGAIFHEHCVRIVQEARFAEQRVTRVQSELAGLVRVTCVQAFALRHLMPALGEFQDRFPAIHVKLSCSNRTLDLGDDGYDLGIRITATPGQNLVARKLAVNRKVLCAAPAYLARRGTPRVIEDLAGHDGVLFPPMAPKRAWSLRRDGKLHVVPVAARFETDDMDASHAAVVAGLGIGVLPIYVAADDLRRGRLAPLLREVEILPDFGIYLVYLPNRTLPRRVRTLIDFLVQRFEPAPPWEAGW
ncbi:MAG TPA: LysR family transcriptional regulator [Burkholderiaceae bacterium]|nr:LysR family transcriptional regulator [Burkholderiaceae bacterium]